MGEIAIRSMLLVCGWLVVMLLGGLLVGIPTFRIVPQPDANAHHLLPSVAP